MLKIGFNRRDPESRKFYFDDSQVLTSNPPKYKIWYVDDESDIDYVLCSDVFYLKPANIEKKQEKEIQPLSETIIIPETEIKKAELAQPPIPKTTIDLNQVEIIPEKKKRGRPRKNPIQQVVNSSNYIVPTNTEAYLSYKSKFEYKAIVEPFTNEEELTAILNKYGNDCWELCGFEMIKNLTKKNEILCIFKRRM